MRVNRGINNITCNTNTYIRIPFRTSNNQRAHLSNERTYTPFFLSLLNQIQNISPLSAHSKGARTWLLTSKDEKNTIPPPTPTPPSKSKYLSLLPAHLLAGGVRTWLRRCLRRSPQEGWVDSSHFSCQEGVHAEEKVLEIGRALQLLQVNDRERKREVESVQWGPTRR